MPYSLLPVLFLLENCCNCWFLKVELTLALILSGLVMELSRQTIFTAEQEQLLPAEQPPSVSSSSNFFNWPCGFKRCLKLRLICHWRYFLQSVFFWRFRTLVSDFSFKIAKFLGQSVYRHLSHYVASCIQVDVHNLFLISVLFSNDNLLRSEMFDFKL